MQIIIVMSKRAAYNFFIILIILIECLFSRLLLLQDIILEKDYWFSIPVFFLNSVLSILFVIQWIEKKDRSITMLLVISYVFKLLIVLQKEFITETILFSDMEAYQNDAVLFFYYGTPLHGGNWSAAALFMGLIYKMFGIQTLLLRHFNLTMILMSGLAVYRALRFFHVQGKIMKWVLLWIQWSPYLVNNSTTVHRESMINVFVAFSLLFFVQWLQEGKTIHIVLTITLILPAVTLHSGMFGVVIGYVVIVFFYSSKEKKALFNLRRIVIIAILIAGIMLMYLKASHIFFQKFSNQTLEKIVKSTEHAVGGSYYSVGSHITGFREMMFYTPLRMLYFYLSPMPWDWRGLRDAIGFCVSGLLYTLVFTLALWEILQKEKNCTVVRALFLIMIIFGIIFGWGVKNAGTAIRHRDKVISISAVILALCLDDIDKNNSKRRIKFLI